MISDSNSTLNSIGLRPGAPTLQEVSFEIAGKQWGRISPFNGRWRVSLTPFGPKCANYVTHFVEFEALQVRFAKLRVILCPEIVLEGPWSASRMTLGRVLSAQGAPGRPRSDLIRARSCEFRVQGAPGRPGSDLSRAGSCGFEVRIWVRQAPSSAVKRRQAPGRGAGGWRGGVEPPTPQER